MPETVAIHHPKDPTRPTLIRADRFDPDRHRIWNPNPTEDDHGDPEGATEGAEERPEQEEGQPARAQEVETDAELSETDADA